MLQSKKIKTLDEIYTPIKPYLLQIEKELNTKLDKLGFSPKKGKFLRPALNLFAAETFKEIDYSKDVILATALELIHLSSLIHDDILDDTTIRRSGPSFHIPLGLKKALIFGDHLFTQALMMIQKMDEPPILSAVIDTVQTMCEGQWVELNLDHKQKLSEDKYLEIIKRKTASLFACACKTGALLRKADEKEIENFYEFGLQFGMAYQLLDDYDDLINNLKDPIILKLTDLGGADYCIDLAKEYLKKTRAALSLLTNPVVKESYALLVDWLKASYKI